MPVPLPCYTCPTPTLPLLNCCLIVQVDYVSVPLSSDQAGHSFKPHMYAFDAHQVAPEYWEKRCNKTPSTAAPKAATTHRLLLLQQSNQQPALRLRAGGPAHATPATAAATTAGAGHMVLAPRLGGEQLEGLAAAFAGIDLSEWDGGTNGNNSSSSPQDAGGAAPSDHMLQLHQVHQQQQQQQHRLWLQLPPPLLATLVQKVHVLTQRLTQAVGLQQPEAAAAVTPEHDSVAEASRAATGRQLAAAAAGQTESIASMRGVQLQRLVLQQFGVPPEWHCDSLRLGDAEVPIPIIRVEHFDHMQDVLKQSYQAFTEVRQKLKV